VIYINGTSLSFKILSGQAVVVHAFNPGTLEAEAGRFLQFKASLVYRVSSRTARAIKRNSVSKKTKDKQKNKTKNKQKNHPPQKKPNQTKPNQTKPNQTKPNQNKTKQNKTKKPKNPTNVLIPETSYLGAKLTSPSRPRPLTICSEVIRLSKDKNYLHFCNTKKGTPKSLQYKQI
jgi:outer membrane biosynthesis protein TonB